MMLGAAQADLVHIITSEDSRLTDRSPGGAAHYDI